jgi:peptidylprolyl isomerase
MKIRKQFFLFLLSCSVLSAEDNDSQVSETLGYMIGKNLQRLDIQLDLNKLIEGIHNASLEKEPPMTEEACIRAIESIQKKRSIEQGKKNLQQAEVFLADQAKKEGMTVLESGKVQYHIIKEGHGKSVQADSTSLIRYTIKELGNSSSDSPKEGWLSLNEVIPGLKTGIIGMREGEQRIVYVHPELAYGEMGGFVLPSNLLLIFEIEILKANRNEQNKN